VGCEDITAAFNDVAERQQQINSSTSVRGRNDKNVEREEGLERGHESL
jgi:hypothetical protein